MLVPAGGTVSQAATALADSGDAISMFYMIRGCGQTVGVTIGSTIFRYQLADVLKANGVNQASYEAAPNPTMAAGREIGKIGSDS